MNYKYIYPVCNNTFAVYSNVANLDYLVSVECTTELEKAKDIAEKEISKWTEANDENDPYWNKGFVEVVKDALDKANIIVKIYVRLEETE